jgi:hypothetical protein
MKPFIYLRGLRQAQHTVFGVNDGQKYYWDSQFNKKVAYSSGQQVKRSMIESMTSAMNVPFAAITFNWEIDKKENKASQKEVHSPCDPSYPDQLIGGYMKAETGSFTVKRRSPLSISAMRPLHPLLGGLEKEEENLTFDRTAYSERHNVNVFWLDGKKRGDMLTEEELNAWLTTNKRNLPSRAFIQGQTRASGLFVYDVAIDLRTLFCVSTNKLEPELFPEMEKQLREAGWVEGENVFGKCLICPANKRKEIIGSLAHALINWRITSNQARTFSPMETLAVAISDNANQITYAIRADLKEDTDRLAAEPKVDETAKANIFVTPACAGYIKGAFGSVDAISSAELKLVELMEQFDYENQLVAS